MRKRFFLTLGIAAALVFPQACRKQAPPTADVWATVNGVEIKRDEVDKYYRSQVNPDQQRQPLSQEEALSLRLNVLDELINNEILLERAKKLDMEATDGEVEDKFTEFKSPYTEEEFQRQLKQRGLSVDDLKRELRRQLSIQKLINREVKSKITLTDQDVTDFYNQNRAQFNVAEPQYRIAQIVVTPGKDPQVRNRKNDDASSDLEARRKCAALLERLNEGADFSQLAMDYSEDPVTSATGGDLGFIPESSLNQSDPSLKRIVLGMRPGQISGVIALHNTYRILKLISREPAGQRELSDPQVQQSIRTALLNRKEQLLRAAYMAIARDDTKVVNYLARQIVESAGKLPVVTPAQEKTETPEKK